MTDYWSECVGEAFCDAGITATPEQIKTVAGWVESGHDNYRMAFGVDVADANYSAAKDQELASAKASAERERNKVHCEVCKGTGREVTHGPYHSSDSECYKCRGAGRHDP